jgi:hypothetical protein
MIGPEVIGIGAAAACFARLTAPENASNVKFLQFAACLIRNDQIRGHEEIYRTTWNSASTMDRGTCAGTA